MNASYKIAKHFNVKETDLVFDEFFSVQKAKGILCHSFTVLVKGIPFDVLTNGVTADVVSSAMAQ